MVKVKSQEFSLDCPHAWRGPVPAASSHLPGNLRGGSCQPRVVKPRYFRVGYSALHLQLNTLAREAVHGSERDFPRQNRKLKPRSRTQVPFDGRGKLSETAVEMLKRWQSLTAHGVGDQLRIRCWLRAGVCYRVWIS